MEKKKIGVPFEGLAELSRKAAAEGAVLLRNEEQVLPLRKEDKVAVFGRCQIDYYRSGTGSGGAVNVAYTTNLLEGLKNSGKVVIHEELAQEYEAWIQKNPFDNGGGGWACEPWCQKEMPVSETLIRHVAETATKAIMVIGRTAGEDKDNAAEEGSYLLTKEEINLIEQITKYFSKVILVFNVGNIMDMSFMELPTLKNKIQGVLYAWHGGMEGGNAAADVLTGAVVPQGKLTDTIARDIKDYPSDRNHGGKKNNYYQEDIYVGYRYFETFDKKAVLYPFGFGLSYTEFQMEAYGAVEQNKIVVTCKVTNVGEIFSGREVVQLYVEAPQGKLGKPARELIAFAKTKLLAGKEGEEIILTVPLEKLASFDDSGVTGYANSYVLEQGEYLFYIGNNVRDAKQIKIQGEESYSVQKTRPVLVCEEACAPAEEFDRLTTGSVLENQLYQPSYKPVPVQTIDLAKRIKESLPKEMEITGNQGLTLQMVAEGTCSMEKFIAQLTKEELATIVRGEGMCSIKVTPGTAAAFGGVSDQLLEYGIPVACCADGPSGIRMDNGLLATQLPIGTLLACTWDTELIEELYTLQGKELVRNEIDTLLGPGINIHRHPLNGRNFEYFSEDPLITGKMAAAVVRGIGKNGGYATVKHLACNSQETGRHVVDAVVSQRALREIYLKGFELAVKEGNAKSIMTAYNPLNGHWTASNYDLVTTILRKEWGYTGIVMTDWWAQMNDVVHGGEPSRTLTADMIRAQNDIYMVVGNNCAELNVMEDNTLESIEKGNLTIGELQRNAANVCRFLINTPAFERFKDRKYVIPKFKAIQADSTQNVQDITLDTKVVLDKETKRTFRVENAGVYKVIAKLMSKESNTAQTVCKAYLNDVELNTFQTNGTEGKWLYQILLRIMLEQGNYELKIEFLKPGMEVEYLEFVKEEPDIK